ncbi:MAG: hypothetical protein P0Y66_17895 [Candidatus Kaistia colombiensis]|nr:MAG: hypothetical protein P0Y66_17895 [Kaistia sp.]
MAVEQLVSATACGFDPRRGGRWTGKGHCGAAFRVAFLAKESRQKGSPMRFGIAVAVGLAGALLCGPAMAAERTVPQSEAALRYSFSPIVKRVSPAVVNVYASRVVQQRASPFMDDPFFRRFFGGEMNNAPRKRVQQSLGSGVIVDASGIVVTNYHVIANADEVKVALSDKRELRGRGRPEGRADGSGGAAAQG